MNIASTALMGLLFWSGSVAGAATTPPVETAEPVPDVAPLKAASDRSHVVKITGYNAVPAQTDSTPDITGWGVYSNPEVVAAVSQDLLFSTLPYGTVVALETTNPTGKYCGYDDVQHLIGYRVIADAMNPRHTKMVDILFDVGANVEIGSGVNRKKVNAAKVLASCGGITVRVVGKVGKNEIPATQAELVMRVEKTLAAGN